MGLWIRRRFRDDEVWAECNAAGALNVAASGLVRFRYKPAGKAYNTRAERLEPVAGATPEELADADAAPPPAKKPKARGGRAQLATMSFESRRPAAEAIQLWTDGACTGNPGPAGLGVVYVHRDERRELSEYLGQGTNNIAELTAILRAVALVEDPGRPVDILTDSSYCIGLLTKNWKPKANVELVAELRRAVARLEDVRLLKVPGHAGVPLNERADELARDAITRGLADAEY